MTIWYPDRHANVVVKVKRAEQHIRDLGDKIKTFIKADPYAVSGQKDLKTGTYVYKLRVIQRPPLEWSAIVGDAIHNLRSSLDILVWQLILAQGNTPSRGNAFPVANNAKEFKARLKGKVKGVSPQALQLFAATEPYKRGKAEGLWILNELDIRDKHRLLVPVFAGYGGFSFKETVADNFTGTARNLFLKMPDYFLTPAYKGPLKNDSVLYRTDRKLDNDPKFRINIAFGEGEIVEGDPVVPTLLQFLDLVKGIIEPFLPMLIPHGNPLLQ